MSTALHWFSAEYDGMVVVSQVACVNDLMWSLSFLQASLWREAFSFLPAGHSQDQEETQPSPPPASTEGLAGKPEPAQCVVPIETGLIPVPGKQWLIGVCDAA